MVNEPAGGSADPKPGLPKGLLWIVVLAGIAVVVWQVANGGFVTSISGPGGTEVKFAQPRDPDVNGQSLRNSVEQSGGTGNRAAINGSDNRIVQQGTGNSATIGGLPSGDAADSHKP